MQVDCSGFEKLPLLHNLNYHLLLLSLLLLLLQLAPGGVLFFRESCFRPSGDRPRKGNPTHYRCGSDIYQHTVVDDVDVYSSDRVELLQAWQEQATQGQPHTLQGLPNITTGSCNH
jgi:hypothetical protein